jgi:hypothetical protein
VVEVDRPGVVTVVAVVVVVLSTDDVLGVEAEHAITTSMADVGQAIDALMSSERW